MPHSFIPFIHVLKHFSNSCKFDSIPTIGLSFFIVKRFQATIKLESTERHCSTNNIMSILMIRITSLSMIFNLKAASDKKYQWKRWYLYQLLLIALRTLSINLTWLYFVEPSGGPGNLSITGCMFLFLDYTMFSIILSVKKGFNDKDGFFTDLAARRRPGLFLYTFSAPRLWIGSSLCVFHSSFTFFLKSIYLTLRSAYGGALS